MSKLNFDVARRRDGYFASFDFKPDQASKTVALLSVQAGQSHYCSPREQLNKLSDYNLVEICIFFLDSKLSLADLKPAMPEDLYERLIRNSGSAGHVKLADVQAIADALIKVCCVDHSQSPQTAADAGNSPRP